MIPFLGTMSFLAFAILLTGMFLPKYKGKVRNKNGFITLGLSFIILTTCFALDGGNTKKTQEETTSKQQSSAIKTEDKSQATKKEELVATSTQPTGELKVHFINVGQADSILVQQGDQAMLVDAGNNADDKTVKAYLDSVGVKELNTLIGTHAHEDHIGGMDYIINSLKVGKIYIPKQVNTTKTFEDVITATKNKGLQFTAPKVGESFNIGQAKCTILAPNNEKYEDINDSSIVVKVEFGQNSFLLTGDAEAISEMEMVKAGANLKADVLKVGHHGSKSSTCANFLSAVSPKYAVISVGKGNDYGHPVQSTLDRLKGANVQLFRTDECGTIVATSNGKDISFNAQPGTYNGIVEKSTVTTNTTTNNDSSSNQTSQQKSTPTPPPAQQQNSGITVWLSATGKSYHAINNCGKMNPDKARQVSLEEAKRSYSPCSKCHPPQ